MSSHFSKHTYNEVCIIFSIFFFLFIFTNFCSFNHQREYHCQFILLNVIVVVGTQCHVDFSNFYQSNEPFVVDMG